MAFRVHDHTLQLSNTSQNIDYCHTTSILAPKERRFECNYQENNQMSMMSNYMLNWEQLFRPEKPGPDNEMFSEARKLDHRNYYYNVVSYIHIPLVP